MSTAPFSAADEPPPPCSGGAAEGFGNPGQTRRKILSLWDRLRYTDRTRLLPQYRKWKSSFSGKGASVPGGVSGLFSAEETARFLSSLERAAERSLFPHAEKLKCEFPEELPVSAKASEIGEALKTNQVVIVCGATGSGKTTQLPKVALKSGYGRRGRIGCTQPRRIAASALARRLSGECGCECGKEIGYQVRFDDRTCDSTVVKFMTDGILLAEIRDDPALRQYDCIILDEVHERTLNIDFLLGYLKLLLPRRKELRVIISSATLDAERLSDFFGGSPVIEVEGRLYPVEDCYLEPEEEEDLPESVSRAAAFLEELDPRGDILVFLPGEREIRSVAELLNGRGLSQTEILPLYGRLSSGEQERIFLRGNKRRIILSTNVAETSLTIPGIRFVIDSGLVRLSRYNPGTRIQELRVEFVSRASARQRRGRCGRLRDGVCVHLYSEEALAAAPEYTDPEIRRSSLAGVILQMAALRLPGIETFPFVDPPSSAQIREGIRTLEDLQAIDGERRLTKTGRELARMPLDPHLGRILLESLRRKVSAELLVICAFLSIQDPRERPFEHAKAADEAQRRFRSDRSDFLSALKLWDALCGVLREKNGSRQALRRFAKEHYLNYRRLREWSDLAEDLAELLEGRGGRPPSPADVPDPEKIDYDAVHKALLCGLPRQMAVYRQEEKLYSDMSGRKSVLFPGSGLAARRNPPRHILFFARVETSRVFSRCNAEADPLWLEETAPHLCKRSYDQIAWDEKSGFVYARERVTAGQILVHPGRRRHYSSIDPGAARTVFIREALVSGRAVLPGSWLDRFRSLTGRLRTLEIRMRRPGALLDEEALAHHLETLLPPGLSSLDALRRDWLASRRDYTPAQEDILCPGARIPEAAEFPDRIVSCGESMRLSYVFDPGEENDGITVFIPEDRLNLPDRHFPDYLVPGFLLWKAEFYLRSLPKAVRRELNPLSDCAEALLRAFREGEIFTGQPFPEALCEFLNENYGTSLSPSCFDSPELPGYLRMKLALTGAHGEVRKILLDYPPEKEIPNRLSPGIKTAGEWSLSGWKTWPGGPGPGGSMPEWIELPSGNGKKAWLALTEESEEAVGRVLFLKRGDAQASHRKGLFRLYSLSFAPLIRHLRSILKSPGKNMERTFFSAYSDWREDLLQSAVFESFGRDPWEIRSAETWESLLENSRDGLAGIVSERMRLLSRILELHASLAKTLEKIPEDSFTGMDVREQMDFLFRNGFLKTPQAVENYVRYFRSLNLRLERAVNSSPAKDEAKGEAVTPYLRKFRLLAESSPGWEQRNESFREYFLLLEEARIAAYTPELKGPLKSSPAVLEKKWESLDFS